MVVVLPFSRTYHVFLPNVPQDRGSEAGDQLQGDDEVRRLQVEDGQVFLKLKVMLMVMMVMMVFLIILLKCDGYESKMDRCLSDRIDLVDVNQM